MYETLTTSYLLLPTPKTRLNESTTVSQATLPDPNRFHTRNQGDRRRPTPHFKVRFPHYPGIHACHSGSQPKSKRSTASGVEDSRFQDTIIIMYTPLFQEGGKKGPESKYMGDLLIGLNDANHDTCLAWVRVQWLHCASGPRKGGRDAVRWPWLTRRREISSRAVEMISSIS